MKTVISDNCFTSLSLHTLFIYDFFTSLPSRTNIFHFRPIDLSRKKQSLYPPSTHPSTQIHNITCTILYPTHPPRYTISRVPYHTLLIFLDTQSYSYPSLPYLSFLIHNLTCNLPYPTHPSWYKILPVLFHNLLILPDTQSNMKPSLP